MAKFIFTKNALNRVHEVNLSQKIIYDTVENSDNVYPGREPEVKKYQKNWDFGLVTVIGKKTNRGDFLVISCGAQYNEAKFYKKPEDPRYKNASFLKRIFLDIIKTFGL